MWGCPEGPHHKPSTVAALPKLPSLAVVGGPGTQLIAASPSCYQLPFQATLEPQRPASSDALGTAATSDPLRLSPNEARAIYQHGFETWSALHAAAREQPRWPSSYLNLHAAFRHHPSYGVPLQASSQARQNGKYTCLSATGCSAWGCSHGCEHGLPAFQEHEDVDVESLKPFLLSISLVSEPAADLVQLPLRTAQHQGV